jgi:hypothetical protein
MFRLNRNKQKTNRNSLIGSIVCNFYRKFMVFFGFFGFFRFFSVFSVFSVFSRFFRFFLGFFCLFRNSLFWCFGCFASIPKQIDPKQTEDPPKQFKREYFWVFFRKFRVVSVCFGLLRNSSVCFGCFDIGSKHRNKSKLFVIGFTKQTETNAKQILFRFVSVRTETYFCLFRGHPTQNHRRCLRTVSLVRDPEIVKGGW